MEQKVQTYFELKQQQKDIEQQLSVLRDEIVAYCAEQGVYETQVGGYTVKTVLQNREGIRPIRSCMLLFQTRTSGDC